MRRRRRPSIILWAALGAIGAAVVMAGIRGYSLRKTGFDLSAYPIEVLAFKIMRLHDYALYGGLGGACIGLLETLVWWLRGSGGRAGAEAISGAEYKIQSIRGDRAEDYMSLRQFGREAARAGSEPPIENKITARNGTITYRVLAYRQLSEEELKRTILEALEDGTIEEPEAGGSVTLKTRIGLAEA